ncbi:RmlC-like cupin domain-containing protein [Paraphoma chrysanthemicola]|nr:RmlC-like cupin domain-containing protein [Paraphoma chrysanthemicola]
MSPSLTLTPLTSLHITTHSIPPHSHLPNTSTHPLIIYHSVYPAHTSPSLIETHLRTTSLVPAWRYTMYTTTHYHSSTHEVLCVYAGRARLLFGGEGNPGKVEVVVGKGDVLVVPAGVGHRLLEDLAGDGEEGYMMVGAYPRGCSWDMCYGKEEEEGERKRVGEVKWLEKDPMYGDDGPVVWGVKELAERSGKRQV